MKSFAIKITAILLAIGMCLGLTACGGSGSSSSSANTSANNQSTVAEGTAANASAANNTKGIPKLSFKSAASYDFLKTLNGQTVSINGYMATSSPADGSFLFLMNLPYQSCPFCKPNTSQLSNTMEVYPKSNQSFDYTTQAIAVKGTLQVAETEDASFTDMYGYEFNFKIVDATYTILKDDELSPELAIWQQVANSDLINEIYSMYDYTNFLCTWPDYYVNSYTDAEGNTIPGYYLYASDAENFLYNDGAQYNYGYQEGYFDDLVEKAEKLDANALSGLVDCIRESETLAKKALKELEDGKYTSEYKYIDMFDNEDYVFTLDDGEELAQEWEDSYYKFSDWLGQWEM